VANEKRLKCSICLLNIRDAAVMDCCIHRTCLHCIRRWLSGERKSSCPTCRKVVRVVYHNIKKTQHSMIQVPQNDEHKEARYTRFWNTHFEQDRLQLKRETEELKKASGNENMSSSVLTGLSLDTLRLQRMLYEHCVIIEQSKGMARKDVSHSYFIVCPHEVYRILKFIRKELFVLYGYKHKHIVGDLAQALIPCLLGWPGLQTRELQSKIEPILGKYTARFISEVTTAARSNYNTYDELNTNYEYPSYICNDWDSRVTRESVSESIPKENWENPIVRKAFNCCKFRVWNEVRPPLENNIELALQSEIYLTSLQFRNYDRVEPWMSDAQKKCISWNAFIRIDPTKHHREFVPLPPTQQSFYHNLTNSFTERGAFTSSVYSTTSDESSSASSTVADQWSSSEFASEPSNSVCDVVSSACTNVSCSSIFTTSTASGENSTTSSTDCCSVVSEENLYFRGNTESFSYKINEIPSSGVRWSDDSTGSSCNKEISKVVQENMPKNVVISQPQDYSKWSFGHCMNLQKKLLPVNVAQKRPRNLCLSSSKSIKPFQRKKLRLESISSDVSKQKRLDRSWNVCENANSLFLNCASTPGSVYSSHNQSYSNNVGKKFLHPSLLQPVAPTDLTSSSNSKNLLSAYKIRQVLKRKHTVKLVDSQLSNCRASTLQENDAKSFGQSSSHLQKYQPKEKISYPGVYSVLKLQFNETNEIKSEPNVKKVKSSLMENRDNKFQDLEEKIVPIIIKNEQLTICQNNNKEIDSYSTKFIRHQSKTPSCQQTKNSTDDCKCSCATKVVSNSHKSPAAVSSDVGSLQPKNVVNIPGDGPEQSVTFTHPVNNISSDESILVVSENDE